MLTKKETYKLELGTYVRTKWDTGATDGILIENYKDEETVKVFFPYGEGAVNIDRDQLYKAGKVIGFNFNDSGLWD